MDINICARRCMDDRHFRKSIYHAYMQSDGDYFAENYSGEIEEAVLYRCLLNARYNRKVCRLIFEFMRFCDKSSLSGRTIEAIKTLRKKDQVTCIHSLAHCQLTFFQQLMLIPIANDLELFDAIMYRMIESHEFSKDDLRLFLEISLQIDRTVIQYCISKLEKQDLCSDATEKIRWLEQYLSLKS